MCVCVCVCVLLWQWCWWWCTFWQSQRLRDMPTRCMFGCHCRYESHAVFCRVVFWFDLSKIERDRPKDDTLSLSLSFKDDGDGAMGKKRRRRRVFYYLVCSFLLRCLSLLSLRDITNVTLRKRVYIDGALHGTVFLH